MAFDNLQLVKNFFKNKLFWLAIGLIFLFAGFTQSETIATINPETFNYEDANICVGFYCLYQDWNAPTIDANYPTDNIISHSAYNCWSINIQELESGIDSCTVGFFRNGSLEADYNADLSLDDGNNLGTCEYCANLNPKDYVDLNWAVKDNAGNLVNLMSNRITYSTEPLVENISLTIKTVEIPLKIISDYWIYLLLLLIIILIIIFWLKRRKKKEKVSFTATSRA